MLLIHPVKKWYTADKSWIGFFASGGPFFRPQHCVRKAMTKRTIIFILLLALALGVALPGAALPAAALTDPAASASASASPAPWR